MVRKNLDRATWNSALQQPFRQQACYFALMPSASILPVAADVAIARAGQSLSAFDNKLIRPVSHGGQDKYCLLTGSQGAYQRLQFAACLWSIGPCKEQFRRVLRKVVCPTRVIVNIRVEAP